MCKKISNEIIDQRLLGRDVERVGNYTKSKDKMEFLCLLCNTKFLATADSIVNNMCGHIDCKKGKIPTNDNIDSIISKCGIKRLDDIVSAKSKCHFQCGKCGHIWTTCANNIINNGKLSCISCIGQREHTLEECHEKLNHKNISIVAKNGGIDNKWIFQCNDCNRKWEANAHSIINRKYSGCICKMRKKESSIACILEDYKLKFTRDKCIMVKEKRMFIDFFVAPKLFIERHGEQHYFPVRFGGISPSEAISKFYKQIIRDNMLKNYCDENQIKLIEIPFYINDAEAMVLIKEEVKNV